MRVNSKVAEDLLALHNRFSQYNLRNVFETLAVIERYKPVMRLVLDAESFPEIRSIMEKHSVQTVRSHWNLRTDYTTTLGDVYTEKGDQTDPQGYGFVVMASMDEELAAKCMALEDDGGQPAELGAMLGYPPCCVNSYESISEGRDWLTVILENTSFSTSYPYGANRISYLFSERSLFFDYFPCSLDCMPTAEITKNMVSIIFRYGLADLALEVQREMLTPILIRKGIIAFLAGAMRKGNWLNYDLSRCSLHGWRVEPGVEDDFIWDSNRLELRKSQVLMYRDDQLIDAFEESLTESRLLFFERDHE